MDATSTAISAGAGTLAGGGLSIWFIKLAVNRWLITEDAFKSDMRAFVDDCTRRLEQMKQQDALTEQRLAVMGAEQQLRLAELTRRHEELYAAVERDHQRLGKIEPQADHLAERVQALEALIERRGIDRRDQ